MTYLTLLIIALYVFWLLLSGFWNNSLLLTLGAVSTALVAFMAWQIERRYPSSNLFKVLWGIPIYWIWLIGEIIKANLDVLKRIWMPTRYPVSPVIASLPMTQKTPLGRTIYANSITLTPGTVSMDVTGNQVLVHAISAEGLADLKKGDMDRRVSALERTAS